VRYLTITLLQIYGECDIETILKIGVNYRQSCVWSIGVAFLANPVAI